MVRDVQRAAGENKIKRQQEKDGIPIDDQKCICTRNINQCKCEQSKITLITVSCAELSCLGPLKTFSSCSENFFCLPISNKRLKLRWSVCLFFLKKRKHNPSCNIVCLNAIVHRYFKMHQVLVDAMYRIQKAAFPSFEMPIWGQNLSGQGENSCVQIVDEVHLIGRLI